MRSLVIALKDFRHTYRSAFSLAMMFGAPLLITGLLYFAFGQVVGGGSDFALPTIRVQVVNRDQPGADSAALAAGDMLVSFLQSEELTGVVEVTLAPDEARARRSVDGQQASVAVIIPAGFSQAVLGPGQAETITLYQDPTLTLGPALVTDLVRHFLDGFSGANIAAKVATSQLGQVGQPVDPNLARGLTQKYAAWLQSTGHGAEGTAGLEIVAASDSPNSASQKQGMVGLIMAGMIIFFVIFMGAHGAESLIREAESGTLARLFTTPATQSVILGGKFLGVAISLSVQVLLLVVASSALFGITWGQPATVALVSAGLIIAAAGFGLLLMSFIQSSRQTGPVMGGVLTLAGMAGGLFTNGIPNIPPAFETVTLFTPHGWAMRAWKLALAGASPAQVLLPVLVLLGLGLVFFAVGAAVFRRRFN